MMADSIKPGSLQAWLAFTRPKTWGIAVAPVLAALTLSVYETNELHWETAFFTLTIALLMQIVSNMKNDLGYTEKKAETGTRKGLPRATSFGWISVELAKKAISFTIVLSLVNTIILVYFGGWIFLIIGIISVIAAFTYMGGPKPIAYTPFGEITVMTFFGLTAVCGSYYLQTHTISFNAILLSISLGAIASSVLCVNNWRDREHDKSIGRQTLAVVLGDKSFLTIFRFLIYIPFILAVAMAILGNLIHCLIVLLCFPLCLPLTNQLKTLEGEELNKTMFSCVKYELIYSILFSLGLVISM